MSGEQSSRNNAHDKSRFYDSIAADFDQIMNHYDLQRRLEVVFDQLLAGKNLTGLRLLDAGFWHWSCRLANALGIRPYLGLENWPSWSSLRNWSQANGIEIREHIGLHLFPFVLKPTHGLLRMLDRAGSQLGPLYVNQCLVGIKRRNKD